MTEADSLIRFLRAVRRRRWAQTIARHAAAGLAVGAGVGLGIGLALAAWPNGMLAPMWIAAAVGLGMMAGVAAGMVRRPTLPKTAGVVDRAARLKDRVESARQFATGDRLDDYQRLVIRDANRAIQTISARGLFPWRWTREGTWAAAGLCVALIVTFSLPSPKPAEATGAGPPRAVQVEAAELAETVDTFAHVADALDSKALKQLAERLREMLEQLESTAMSSNDAILQLAKMTGAVESTAAPFDALLLEQSMRNVAEGLSALDGFGPAANMLKQGRYDRAAERLDQFGRQIGSGQQTVPSSDGLLRARLQQLATQARSAGLSELSDGLTSLGKAIRSGSQGDCELACRKLGAVVRKYGRRVKAGRALRAQLAGLSQAKARLCKSGGYCQGCRNGGL